MQPNTGGSKRAWRLLDLDDFANGISTKWKLRKYVIYFDGSGGSLWPEKSYLRHLVNIAPYSVQKVCIERTDASFRSIFSIDGTWQPTAT